ERIGRGARLNVREERTPSFADATLARVFDRDRLERSAARLRERDACFLRSSETIHRARMPRFVACAATACAEQTLWSAGVRELGFENPKGVDRRCLERGHTREHRFGAYAQAGRPSSGPARAAIRALEHLRRAATIGEKDAAGHDPARKRIAKLLAFG